MATISNHAGRVMDLARFEIYAIGGFRAGEGVPLACVPVTRVVGNPRHTVDFQPGRLLTVRGPAASALR